MCDSKNPSAELCNVNYCPHYMSSDSHFLYGISKLRLFTFCSNGSSIYVAVWQPVVSHIHCDYAVCVYMLDPRIIKLLLILLKPYCLL